MVFTATVALEPEASDVGPELRVPGVQLTRGEQRELLIIEICETCNFTRKKVELFFRLLDRAVRSTRPEAVGKKVHAVVEATMPGEAFAQADSGTLHHKLNEHYGVEFAHGQTDRSCQLRHEVITI